MPKSITASVGLLGKNLQPDTLTVQNLLNNVPINLGGPNPRLDPDGKCGNKTTTAIQMFQLKHFGWTGTDGRVDPGGITLTMLNAYSPDPVIPQPQPQPQPEALSDDFLVWLRFNKGKHFSHPYDPKEFVFTIVDMTNQRRASYGLKFNGKAGTAAADSGSGGQTARVKLQKPTTISGLAGQAVYQTVVTKGSGPSADRLVSKLFVVLQGNAMLVAKLNCHLLKPGPDGQSVSGASDPAATPMTIDGQFHYNLNGSFVKL